MPFSDLGIIVQTGSFMEQALLCSRHCTKGFTACFSSVVHGSTAPASAGSLLERENLRSHPRPAASECALEQALHLRLPITVWEALLSHFVFNSSPQLCEFRGGGRGHKTSKRRSSLLRFGHVSIDSYILHLLKPDTFLIVWLRFQHLNPIFLDASCCKVTFSRLNVSQYFDFVCFCRTTWSCLRSLLLASMRTGTVFPGLHSLLHLA